MLTLTILRCPRRVGRPPIRWIESIEDLRNPGVGVWKGMVTDREKWRSIIGVVKAGNWL
jgi:hypothetical protein